MGTKKPAPAAISISLTEIIKSFGLPINFGLSDNDFCVFAIQIGKFSYPKSAMVFKFCLAKFEYSTFFAPYILVAMVLILS